MLVVSAGSCSPDNAALARVVQKLTQVDWIAVESGAELKQLLVDKSPDLIFVNRVFDATGEDGIEIIEEFAKASNESPHMMLISNFDWAQTKARAAGALAGFGKSQLFDTATRLLIKNALGV